MLNAEEIIKEPIPSEEFEFLSLAVFRHQYANNEVYRNWVNLLEITPKNVLKSADIPFLPIELFKSKTVLSGGNTENCTVFTSSGTSSAQVSKHYVSDIGFYRRSFMKGFERIYGSVKEYCILALLPSYLERQGSSLIYMCEELILQSGHPLSGFFLNNTDELLNRIEKLKQSKQKVLLFGVSYALLDLINYHLNLPDNFIVMETGGMKGTRREMMKEELLTQLQLGFTTKSVHSEYGMTELLSQAYSTGEAKFKGPPWMRFYIREVEDPLSIRNDNRGGGINVIDLANLNSCSFIATQDLGRLNEKGELELLGRFDHSDVRGCNLMYGTNL